jgi:anti-sigma B factor antagonist
VSNLDDLSRDFAVRSSSREGVAVVAVTGQADLHTAPELRAALADAVGSGASALIVDLSETTFIDSMTLGVLLGALKRVTAAGGRLAVVCPDRHVRRVFEITSLDRVLALFATLDEAIAGVRAEDSRPDE